MREVREGETRDRERYTQKKLHTAMQFYDCVYSIAQTDYTYK